MISAIPEPRHGRIRRVINTVVAAHRTNKAEPFIRDLAARLVDDAVAAARTDGTVDLVATVIDAYPSAVIAEILGVPVEDHEPLPALVRRAPRTAVQRGGRVAVGRPPRVRRLHPGPHRRAPGGRRSARRRHHPVPAHRRRRRVPQRHDDPHAGDVPHRGRQRDDPEPARQLPPLAGAGPGALRPPPHRPAAGGARRRGVAPPRLAGTGARPRGARRHRDRGLPAPRRRSGRVRPRVGEPRRVRLRRSRGVPISTAPAHATTSRSVPVRTCAPARRWRASRRSRCWRRSRRGSNGSRSSTATSSTPTPCSGRSARARCP